MKKIIIKTIAILMIIIILAYSNMPVLAVNQSDVNELDDKIKEAEEEKENVEQEKSSVAKQVEELTYKITEYESELRILESELDELNNQISTKEAELAQAEEEYKLQEEMYEARMVALYESGEATYLDVLLSSEDILDMISSYYLITELANNDVILLEEIEAQKQLIEQTKVELETAQKEVTTKKASVQSTTTQLQSAKNTKNAQISQLTAEEKSLQEEIEQFEEDKREIEAELARIAAASKPSSGNNITSTPSASGYISPISGGYITTGWYGYAGHTGVDYAKPSGTPIYAAKSGTVVISTALKYSNGSYRSYGEYIVIDHHDGTMTLYAHGLSGSRKVSVGQSVSQGQQIMSVGSTGNSTGPHLHFEVRVNGKAVNPTPYLP